MNPYRSIQDLAKDNLAKWKDLQTNDTRIECAFPQGRFTSNNLPDFRKGELNVIAGHVGSGRTFLLTQLAVKMSENANVLFCPFGWSQQAVTYQIYSMLAKTRWGYGITQRIVNSIDTKQWEGTEEKLAAHNLLVGSSDIDSLDTWLNELEDIIEKKGTEVIVIDDILVHKDIFNKKICAKYKNQIIKGLRKLAEEKNVCIILGWLLKSPKNFKNKLFFNLLDLLHPKIELSQIAHQILLLNYPECSGVVAEQFKTINENEIQLTMVKSSAGYHIYSTFLYVSWNTSSLFLNEELDGREEFDIF